MKIFMLHRVGDELELLGDFEMKQIPHVGEHLLARVDAGLQSYPVTAVRHFVTEKTGAQGAFLTVGEPELRAVPEEMARFFAG